MTTIIFDVGGVIVKADQVITFRALENQGVNKDKAKLFFDNKDYKEFSRGKINGKEFYQILVNDYLQYPLSYEQIVSAHNKHIYGVDKKVVKLLSKLSVNKLVFLTDTNIWQIEREKELVNLSSYSTTIFRSNEIHMLKTDKDCFPYVINQLKCESSQALLIDDSIEKIQIARKNNLQTFQFTNSKKLVKFFKKIELL